MNQLELTQLLRKASNSYYNSEPIMTDYEFDRLCDELQELEKDSGIIYTGSPTVTVGAVVLDDFEKKIHDYKPMLSLQKVHTVEEIGKFSNGHKVVGMVKCDGLSVRLTYRDGVIVCAETRGNGIEGNVITEQAKLFKNIPLTIDRNGLYVVDGEAVITSEDFNIINSKLDDDIKFKNQRNLASGTINSLDTSILRERPVSFILWDVIVDRDENNRLQDKLVDNFIIAKNLGFQVVKYQIGNTENILKELPDENIPYDGIVFKFNDLKYGESLGRTDKYFNDAIAYKYEDEIVDTKLIDIEWSVGKTGVLTPVAIFEPVELDGTTVERASLHNLDVLESILGSPYVGENIQVIKANMIIPQVKSGEKVSLDKHNIKKLQTLAYPNCCPSCGAATKIKVSDDGIHNVQCTNTCCKGILVEKFNHFVSKNAMNIDGLSKQTLKFLVDKGWINTFSSIYKLYLYKDEWIKAEGFGEKSVNNIIESIEDSRNTTLDRLINSVSIPNVGLGTSRDIAKFCDNNITKFKDIVSKGWTKQFTKIDGVGDVVANSILEWSNNNWIEFLELSKYVAIQEINNSQSNNLKGKTFVITGSVNYYKNRDEIKTIIENNGGKVSGSVSKNTTYLINNDIESNSSKNKKAKELGVKIITEDEFRNMIG